MATSTESEIVQKPPPQEYAYLPPPREELGYYQEGLKEKFIRKTKDNPFVPIGVALTTLALTYGLWQMKTGNTRRSQTMMRMRIGAQGFTLCAVLGGVFYSAMKAKKKPAN
ncbi:HIG1 domain family member 2A, mitochondrial-like [Haliotis cracherodii]|uniref:HIG1 domain family member 2A, mitochondrial-like n=1 Tax=Haliotis cracherodii TaxID=6455 RepID=UPI0039E9A5AA